MRRMILAAAILVYISTLPTTACAGIYNPQEASLWPQSSYFWPLPATLSRFRSTLGDLRGLPIKREASADSASVHDRYWNRIAQLETDEQLGTLSGSDRIELGSCYLRLRKTEEARQILTEAKKIEPRNFMVLANLATVSELSGDWDRAISYLKEALEVWPEMEAGCDPDQLRFYRRAEKYHLILLQQRFVESRNPPPAEKITIDHLFPEWERAREDVEYGPGATSPKEAAELPGDAVPIVQQLVLWAPHDDRLYWLLAELLNSRGDVKSAATVIDDLTYARGFKPEMVMRHRRILLDAARDIDSLTGEKSRGIPEYLFWVTMPRGLPVPAGVGALVQESVWPEMVTEATRDTSLPSNSSGGSSQPSTRDGENTAGTNPSASWLPDLRAVAVGFTAGVVVTLLAALQLREIRRRREIRTGSPPSGAG